MKKLIALPIASLSLLTLQTTASADTNQPSSFDINQQISAPTTDSLSTSVPSSNIHFEGFQKPIDSTSQFNLETIAPTTVDPLDIASANIEQQADVYIKAQDAGATKAVKTAIKVILNNKATIVNGVKNVFGKDAANKVSKAYVSFAPFLRKLQKYDTLVWKNVEDIITGGLQGVGFSYSAAKAIGYWVAQAAQWAL